MASSYFKSKKAFTLIEILLVVAIMGLLSVTALASVSVAISRMSFQGAFNKVEDMMFEPRQMALSGKKIEDCTDIDGDPATEDVVAAGYGLNLSRIGNRYKIKVFSDTHNFSSGYFNEDAFCPDVVEREYVLPEGFEVKVGDGLLGEASQYNFVYLPSDAVFFVTNEIGAEQLRGDYVVIISNQDYSQQLTLNAAGVPDKGTITKLE